MLVADYEAGQPTTALMKTYDIGKGTVLRLLRANGVQLRQQSMADDEITQVIELYGQGLSLARVGERVGRDASYIALVLERAGVPRRDPQGKVR
jgi:histone H3/H4